MHDEKIAGCLVHYFIGGNLLLHSLHAIDGSFGIRPMNHTCAGLRVKGISLNWLPTGDVRFRAGLFSFRYWVDKGGQPERPFCVGQDIWYDE